MNLLKAAWIPVRRKDGTRTFIAPHQITEDCLYVDFPRPDFNASVTQFLIGLLQTCLAPKSDKEWAEMLKDKPSKTAMEQAFHKHLDSFNLFDKDPTKPVFMQDRNPEDMVKEWPISMSLLDGMREQTIKHRKDFFRKNGAITCLCPSCAAAHLYTFQINAWCGGGGYMVSIRGGKTSGLSMLLEGSNLWESLWLNVLPKKVMDEYGTPGKLLFPWMAKTRDKATKSNSDPCYIYWEMPRRIRLAFEKTEPTTCDCCGQLSDVVVKKSSQTNKGPRHGDSSGKFFEHPFSIYETKKDTRFPVSTQIQNVQHTKIAKIIHQVGIEPSAPIRFGRKGQSIRFFGSCMDNAAFVCWIEKVIPWIEPIAPELISWMLSQQEKCIKKILSCIHRCWEVAPDTYLYENLMNQLEPAFYRVIAGKNIKQDWLNALQKVCLKEFDATYKMLPSKTKAWYIRGELVENFKEVYEKEGLVAPEVPQVIFSRPVDKTRRIELSPDFISELMRWWSGNRKFSRESMEEIGAIEDLSRVRSDDAEALIYSLAGKFLETHPDFEGIQPDILAQRILVAAIILCNIDQHGKEGLKRSLQSQKSPAVVQRLYQIKDITKEWESLRDAVRDLNQVNVVSVFDSIINWS